MNWQYPLWYTTEGIALKSNEILVKGQVVKVYPDNDGGLWYYDPETGKEVRVDENANKSDTFTRNKGRSRGTGGIYIHIPQQSRDRLAGRTY